MTGPAGNWRRTAVGRWAIRHPAAALLMAGSLAGYLAGFFAAGALPVAWIAFFPSRVALAPWTVVTYPFLEAGSPFFFLFALYWLWLVGGELEARLGTRDLLVLFFGSAAAGAAGIYLYHLLPRASLTGLAGLGIPLSGLTVAWCLLHPDRTVLFSFILPIPGRVLALLTVALTYLSYGPLRGLFALGGCLFGWLWVARPWRGGPGRGQRRDDLSLLDRLQLWRAKRRMRKVWDADDPDRWVN